MQSDINTVEYRHTDITKWIHALEQRTPGTEVWTVTQIIYISIPLKSKTQYF